MEPLSLPLRDRQVVGYQLREDAGTLPSKDRPPPVSCCRRRCSAARRPGTRTPRRDRRIGRLCGVGLHEARVAVEKVQHEVVDGLLHSADHRLRLAEVALGWDSGTYISRVRRRRCTSNYRVLAAESVLRSQDRRLGRVALLLRKTTIILQPVAVRQLGSTGGDCRRSREAVCAPYPGAARTPAPPHGCSFPPPCRPGVPARTTPPCTSIHLPSSSLEPYGRRHFSSASPQRRRRYIISPVYNNFPPMSC